MGNAFIPLDILDQEGKHLCDAGGKNNAAGAYNRSKKMFHSTSNSVFNSPRRSNYGLTQ